MSHCKKCGKSLKFLNYKELHRVTGKLVIDRHGDAVCDMKATDVENVEYRCPHCKKKLCDNYLDAIDYLLE